MTPSTDTYHSGFTRLPGTDLEVYAAHENVSSDGCKKRDDVDKRRSMLHQIVHAKRSGHILPPKTWVTW